MIAANSRTIFLLCAFFANSELSAQRSASFSRDSSKPDSLAVLRPVVDRMLKDVGGPMASGLRIVTRNHLTYAALDSVSRARKMVLASIPKGANVGVSCPWHNPVDTAGLNEKAGPKGYYVALRIFELTDSTATAGWSVGCGAGVAPISAFGQNETFRLKKINGEWVIVSVVDASIT